MKPLSIIEREFEASSRRSHDRRERARELREATKDAMYVILISVAIALALTVAAIIQGTSIGW